MTRIAPRCSFLQPHCAALWQVIGQCAVCKAASQVGVCILPFIGSASCNRSMLLWSCTLPQRCWWRCDVVWTGRQSLTYLLPPSSLSKFHSAMSCGTESLWTGAKPTATERNCENPKSSGLDSNRRTLEHKTEVQILHQVCADWRSALPGLYMKWWLMFSSTVR